MDFVIQDASKFPERIKPWGTGHALLYLKHTIDNRFAFINADDFFGRKAYKLMLDTLYEQTNKDNYFTGSQLKKTLSDFGTVSRGECI